VIYAPEIREDGSVAGCTVLVVDVTERKRMEPSRRQSQAIASAVLAAAFDAIITIDHRGVVVKWNSAAERLFGYAGSEAVGREMADLIIPPQLREAHRAGMMNYLAKSVGPILRRLVELPALRADGTEFPVDLYITPIAIEGRPLFTGFARDATERKAAQTALKKNEARLRLALDASGAGVWTWDRATGVITADEAYRAMYGFAPDVPSITPSGKHVSTLMTASR
jgi:PAS domain S-box-containing protein